MLHHEQFLSSIQQNNRAHHQHHQQSSSPPSDDNSMSTGTPPHQISRGSPASTALVMSSNNIASSSSNPASSGSSNGGSVSNSANAPNPMMRQFACHAKSMSAGIVVPVPGISNNLATSTGMNQNNMINQTIANQQQQQQQHENHHQRQMSNQSGHSTHNYHHQRSSNGQQHQQQQQQVSKQQVIREHRTHHHRSISSHQHHPHQQQQQQHQLSNHQNNEQQLHHHQQDGSSQNFIDARTGSSIVLSNNTLNNLHHRSASTQLSNIILGSVHPQPAQRTLHLDQAAAVAANYPGHVANSIWSIDENISKSRAKLTASGYIGHPYLFDPSVTDLSCDNLSQAGAPGYYIQHASNLLANGGVPRPAGANQNGTIGQAGGAGQSLSASGTTLTKQAEFLPICDLMFNLLSMIIYFCENVFGVIALIALYYHAASKHWALIGATFMLASNLLCQYLSLRWLCKMKLEESRRKCEAQKELEDEEECERRQYYNRMEANTRQYPGCGSCTWLPDGATEVQLKFLLSIALDAILHIFCLGFLVRYMKLVVPVSDTSRVKKEARDLCMLRMIHGFVQSAPLLLLQAYMVCSQNYTTSVTNLSMTSVILSLLNVCWALASFTKYARRKFLHKFVLTWLGILSQLLWRLGTISSRVAALTIYAVYYNYWMLVVLSLHWVAMFMWLVKPGNLLRDEANMSRSKRLSLAAGAAWIYCFCYLNFEEKNSKTKTGIFYLIMFFENNLLSTVCLTLSSQVIWFKTISILVVYLGFVFGILFMMLYYKYFHVTVLNNGLSISQDSIDSIADQLSPAGKKIAGFKPGTLRLKSDNLSATLRSGSHPEIAKRTSKPPYLTSNHQLHRAPLPGGVFSSGCKPIPNVKRQKIPSTHVRSRHNP